MRAFSVKRLLAGVRCGARILAASVLWLLISVPHASGGTPSTSPLRNALPSALVLVTLPLQEGADTAFVPPEDARKDTIIILEKTPHWAAARSLLLPGWGQVYTGHKTKAVLVAAAQGTLFTLWQIEKRAGDREYEKYIETQDSGHLLESDRHDSRADSYLSWTIIATFLSAVDAYIDAHFYGFEDKVRMEGEEVSFRFY